jgi:hypothetical protein
MGAGGMLLRERHHVEGNAILVTSHAAGTDSSARPAVAKLAWQQALAWRLGRHMLAVRSGPSGLVDVTARLGGLHAQITSSAERAAWARVDGLAPEAVTRALWEERTLVKLWGMRGTLHLLPARELGLWLAAFSTFTGYRIADQVIGELAGTVTQALQGSPLTRSELAAEVTRLSGSAELGAMVRGSWGVYLKPLSFLGKVCFAPGHGQRIRFTTPARWLPGGIEMMSPRQALAEVTRRYLGAFGPANRVELARWWGSGPAQAARMLALLGDEAVEVDIDGSRYWMLAAHVREAESAEPARTVRLLPAFDPWVVGASRTEPSQLATRCRPLVYRSQGWLSPVLLVNGEMAGTWTSRQTGRCLRVEIVPFDGLARWARAAAEAEAARLAGFTGTALHLTWSR